MDESTSSVTEREAPVFSEEMLELLDHQKQIEAWRKQVQERILKLETSYLEDTPMGNIVRGWEATKIFTSRSRRAVSEKERVFSGSSWTVWNENRLKAAAALQEEGNQKDVPGFVKNKKMKKSTSKKDLVADL